MAEPAKKDTAPAKAAPSPKLIPMKGEDGDIRLYTPQEAQQVIDAGGSQASKEEVRAQKLHEEYGGVGQQAITVGQNFASGLTFGVSNPIAVALGADRQAMADRNEENPLLAGGSELLGAVAPALASGGAGSVGTVAKVLGAPVRAVSGLGGLAERGVARVIGREAESLGGRMLQRGLAVGAGGAVEGAAYGVGEQITEATLGNHELTADRLLAGAKGGALFGGLAGGAMGAGGELLATGARKVASVVEGQLQKEGGLTSMLRGEAEGQAFKSTGAQLRDYQKLGQTAEEQAARGNAIGRTLLDEGIVTASSSKSEIATRLQAKVKEVGEELGALRKGLDKASVRPSTANIVDEVRAKVLDPLAALPGTMNEAGAVSHYLDDFVKKAGETPSFDTLHKFRKALDDKIYIQKSALVPTPETEQLRKVRGIIEGEFERSAELAAKELGTSVVDQYKTAKELYSKLITAEKISTKSVARQSANRAISLTDTIMGAGALASMGPSGLLMAGANKVMREYGNQAAADVLNRVTRLQAVQRAAVKTEDELTAGVAKFISGAHRTVKEIPRAAGVAVKSTGASEWSRENYERITKHVADMKNNPDAHEARIARETNELATVAPNVAMAIGMTSKRAVEYLDANTPPSLAPPSKITPLVPRAKQKSLNLDEMKYMRKAMALQNPKETIIHGLNTNTLSLDACDAIKFVHPALFKNLEDIVARAAETREKPEDPIDTDALYRLGLITGVKTHFTQERDFISGVQATKAPPPQDENTQQPQQQPQQPIPPAQVSTTAQHAAQALSTPSDGIQS